MALPLKVLFKKYRLHATLFKKKKLQHLKDHYGYFLAGSEAPAWFLKAINKYKKSSPTAAKDLKS